MTGTLTAHAGLSAVSRVLRSLGLPGLCDTHVRVKQRDRGFSAGQHVESLVLLHAARGDCMEDMESLRGDEGMKKMLGYAAPSAWCVGDFLEAFHDSRKVSDTRAEAQAQGHLSFIPEETSALEGLQRAQCGLAPHRVHGAQHPGGAPVRVARRELEERQSQTIALCAIQRDRTFFPRPPEDHAAIGRLRRVDQADPQTV
jgi:hypothetical protein